MPQPTTTTIITAEALATAASPASISKPSFPDSKPPLPEPSSKAKLSSPPEPTPAPKDAKEPESESFHPDDKPDELADVDIIDMTIFNQIIELDEDDTHEFSNGMASAYFAQAEQTFKDMDIALNGGDLKKLSSLGHFLKGSSAALGLYKVQALCAKIQHYGLKRDEKADEDLTEEESLSRIKTLRLQVKGEYDIAEKWLKKWYDANATAAPDEEDS
ncbi:hypothetical protein C0995_006582 [Termitomyces sp. Mi166|nr:hypothetical protein C0995_006582 [Termitomyces sp. Mi166\